MSLEVKEYRFPTCGAKPLGFYPIVDRASWVKRLVPLGLTSIQLRIKDLDGYLLEKEIQKSVLIAKQNNCRLFINDYWELAIKADAYGVHLGQEDLDSVSLSKISNGKTRLGISTHCLSEVIRAVAYNPTYLAIGPIFHTTLKKMAFSPQGIDGFRKWRNQLDIPLVAIGGITLESVDLLINAGADGIAVVSDVTQNRDPEERVKSWLDRF